MPWRLIFGNLMAHPIRSLLTMGSITIAVFLLCLLQTILVSLNAGVQASAANRLIVQSAVSLFVDLPQSYQAKIESVEGIEKTCKLQWFGGYYQEPANFFAQFGVDPDRFFDVYPEAKLLEGSVEEFKTKRTSCMIGKVLADKYKWKVGDKVPVIGTIFPRVDGKPWDFEVAGIYESKSPNVDNNTLWFHYVYLEESIKSKVAEGPDGVGVFTLRLKPGVDPIPVSAKIDAIFENGPQRTQTTTEAEFQRQFVTMLGSVPFFLSSIGGGVLFAIMLAALNTMLMSGRQRIHDFGIMKALGFTDSMTFTLLLVESLFICGMGGLLGVALSLGSAPTMAEAMSAIFPSFEVTAQTISKGFLLSLGIGLAAGIVPAWQASRLNCVDALRMEV